MSSDEAQRSTRTRRRVLQGLGGSLSVGLAGCGNAGDGSGTPSGGGGGGGDGSGGGGGSPTPSSTPTERGNRSSQTPTATEPEPTPEPVDLRALEIAIRERANEVRAANGVGELDWDEELRKIARKHSKDMIRNQYFDHRDPMSRNWGDRYQAAGYQCAVQVSGGIENGGESIARVSYAEPPSREEIAEDVVEKLRADDAAGPFLAPYWNVHGIGVARDQRVEKTWFYVTQNYC
jgi:uncharacterized protein YkwD